VFWINDGKISLYLKQRSAGVRWFLSFYLQLQSMKLSDNQVDQILLIDEPGNSLHARAQEDVLRVFEDIRDTIQIIYTTHSPYLLNVHEVQRLLAVQRADEEDETSDTRIFTPHELHAASSDTLSPLYTLMGVNFSDQSAIKKENNVILEELSAFYYFKSFFNLCNSKQDVHFLPANGITLVPIFANMFLGWGLEFIIVLDDETDARKIFNKIKKEIYFDDEDLTASHMFKIKNCHGIEDVFSPADFQDHVLEKKISDLNGKKNSEYSKIKNYSKGLLALQFMQKVKDGKIDINTLEPSTASKIKEIVKDITSRLN